MANDTTLTLTAKLVGDFEQNLKQWSRLTKQFEAEQARNAPEAAKRFFDATKKGHQGLKDLSEGSINLKREMKAVGETVGKLAPGFSGLTSELGRFAIGAGSVIAGLTALAGAMAFTSNKLGNFANSMLSMRNAAKRAQMTIPEMRDFVQWGARWGFSSEQMQSAAVDFGESFTKISKNIESFRADLEKKFPQSGKRLADFIKLHPGDVEGAMTEVFKIFDELRQQPGGEAAASAFAQALGLPADFARRSAKEFVDGLKDVKALREELGETDDKLVKLDTDAENFRQAWVETEQIFGVWGEKFKELILPSFTQLVKDFNALFGNKKAIDWAEGFLGALQGPVKALQLMKEIIEWLSGSKIMQFFMSMTPGGGGITDVPGVGPVPGGGGGVGGVGGVGGGGGVGGVGGGGGGGLPEAPPGINAVPGDVSGRPGSFGGAFNVPAGTPLTGPATTITLDNGAKVQVGSRVAEQFKGFFNDLIKEGAPVHDLGGFGTRGNPSQHPIGYAVDWAQGGRNLVSPDVQRWMSTHQEVLNNLESKWGMSGGEHWRNPDTGHFSIQEIYGSEHLKQLGAVGGQASAVKGAMVGPIWGGAQWYGDQNLVNAARAGMDTSTQQKIEGKGTIDIQVNQQKARGKSNPRNILKPLDLPRAVQRQPASSGPQEKSEKPTSSYEFNL